MSEFQATTMRPGYAVSEAQSSLLRSVFGWMTLGLMTTGLVSMFVLNTPGIRNALFGPQGATGFLYLLLFVELGLVFWLSARVMKMSAAKATAIFLLYSGLNGITLSPLAMAYTQASLTSTFMITAGTFASMAVFGYVTKRDLSGMGSFLMMGLFGLIIAMIVSIFWMNDTLNFVISVLGVLIFTGLTAWDVQRLKQMGAGVDAGTDNFRRISILGALSLYLNFINLFIMLLRLMGGRD